MNIVTNDLKAVPYADVVSGNLSIRNFIMVITRDDYQTPYQRSFTVNANVGNLNKFESILNTNGVNNEISKMTLANHAPEIVGLTPVPTGQAEIPNGWNTKRARFILEVQKELNGLIQTSYIQGYTDYFDSASGNIDPNISFFINSITVVAKSYDVGSGRWIVYPRKTFNVISDSYGGSRYTEIATSDTNPTMIRPLDIMQNIYTNNIMQDPYLKVVNTYGSIASNPYASYRNNNDPMSYFTKTLNGYIDAKSTASISVDPESILRAGTSSSYVIEDTPANNDFVRALYSLTGEVCPTVFNLNQLVMIDPGVNNVNRIIDRTRDYIPSINYALNTDITESTLNPTVEVMKATIIANSLNSMLIDNMLSRISVSFGNTAGPQPIAVVTDVNSFIEGVDLWSECSKITNSIKSVLMPVVSDSGNTIIEAFVESDVLGDTTVGVSVNSGPVIVFRFPTFADSLYCPVVTNQQQKNSIVESFYNFMDSTYNV